MEEEMPHAMAAPAPEPAALGMLGRRRRGVSAALAEPAFAPAPPSTGLDLTQGVSAQASGLEAGELFEYAIRAPVTLARQRSALLPILGEAVGGKKVSIYNASVQPKHPLNGFLLKNTTSLHLMQGPITVFDAGAYAGDARIEDLAPGAERLISYALDLRVEVEPQRKSGPRDLISVALRKGTLIARHRAIDETVFRVRNRDQKEKTVLVEHPFRTDWELTEPKKPAERTRDVYRFEVKVAAGKSESLPVKEERQLKEMIALSSIGADVLASYISADVVSDKVKEALHKVLELRDALETTRAERARHEQRISEITQEQGRIRENMARLAANSELSNRYVKKLDEQETELEGLRRKIEGLKTTESKQQRALNDFLRRLDLDG
jgi:hypothetical protein